MATYGATSTTATELSQLICGDHHIQREITLKANCGALSRGTVLEMVSVGSGQWQQLTAADGSNARAILLETVANNASATQKAQAYFVGKFRYDDLVWPDGITTQQKQTAIVAMQDRCMIVDETGRTAVTTTSTTTTTSSTTTTTTTSSSTTTTTTTTAGG